MAGLPTFLTKNSVAITIEYKSVQSYSDIGEPVCQTLAVAGSGVFDYFPEPGESGINSMAIQGKDIRQRFKLFVGPSVDLYTGDYVQSGEDRYEIGFVTPYETHKEAIVLKV